ncbi:phosphatase domain containing paladin 1b isoform X1 [Hemibagrus wyckioides]|uniref:phosphatase domain containing paladin 1b isoform X1 n=1 Tax=Hemibagrus wyckioides TaxID=337641 RepID=UPI00266C1BD5|nr:phosphatase domain containing paladin 1b isoform X1 [Hemibagrus wyckioides]XP_058236649.1 phosphatase domain containing paladin 1b isoform X1 [Hemibagrus wyckioides]
MSGAAHRAVWLPDVQYFSAAPSGTPTSTLALWKRTEMKKQKAKDIGTAGRSSVWIMGTTASAGSQPASVTPTQLIDQQAGDIAEDKRSVSSSSLQALNIPNSKAKSIITNKVAPVVITYNCREEFQIHDSILSANYSVGKISDTLPEHYLVLGEFFMVQDVNSRADVLNTTGSYGAPNFRKAKENYPLFGMGQASLNGFKQLLQRLESEAYEEVIFFCVREEPVVFLHVDKDFIPYTPRKKDNLHENLKDLRSVAKAEQLELSIRKELCDFAKLCENIFYVYNDIENFKDEPQQVKIVSEEDIHVTEEVYKRPQFSLPSYRYYRLPLPAEGAPLEEDFDAFVKVLRKSPSLSVLRDGSKPLPALLFSCQVGVGRTNLGLILGALVFHHLHETTNNTREEDAQVKVQPEFQVIQNLIGRLPKGQQVLDEVNRAIEMCSELHNVKDAIYENKRKMEAVCEDFQIQGSRTKKYFLERTLQSLETYFYLILFNAYLQDQYPQMFAQSFSEWLCVNAWIYRLLGSMNRSELLAPASLITDGTRILVASEFLAPDVLGTAKEMRVANFRRVLKTSVYGMAQPNSEAVSIVLSYLTDERRKHSSIVWVNLQEEMILEGNGQMFNTREPSSLEQPIQVYVQNSQQHETLELALKEEILRSEKWLEVVIEQDKQMRMLKSCHTVQEVFAKQKSIYPGLTYQRIPLTDCCAPNEAFFDQLLDAMKSSLGEDPSSAFIFNCSDGKDRTTTAMVTATLTLWHFNRFPDCVDEEIVSVPDAKYTKGEFEVVMQVVRLLPDGHRMKREVDMALDVVSETMTPMHYHLREIIICSYKQIKTAKSETELQQLRLRSLQYLERYIYLILFNSYLHLEKKDSWRRPFSMWMHQVAARAGIYDILNQLGFPEFEAPKTCPLARLRYRWRQYNAYSLPIRGELI